MESGDIYSCAALIAGWLPPIAANKSRVGRWVIADIEVGRLDALMVSHARFEREIEDAAGQQRTFDGIRRIFRGQEVFYSPPPSFQETTPRRRGREEEQRRDDAGIHPSPLGGEGWMRGSRRKRGVIHMSTKQQGGCLKAVTIFDNEGHRTQCKRPVLGPRWSVMPAVVADVADV